MVAGTSSMRTMVASRKIAVGEADAHHLDDAVVLEQEAAEDDDHDRGRGGDDPGRGGQAVGHRRAAVAGAVPLLPDPGEQEHLVVHRQAEHDGEQHHRHPRLDRGRLRRR